jgi:hypothetical protein
MLHIQRRGCIKENRRGLQGGLKRAVSASCKLSKTAQVAPNTDSSGVSCFDEAGWHGLQLGSYGSRRLPG